MKILYIVNVDWFFISHRLPIALEAISRGCEVHLACALTGQRAFLESKGIHVHEVPFVRNDKNILRDIVTVKRLINVVRNVRPDLMHSVTIKPVLYGGIIGRMFGVRAFVAAISGLGFVFVSDTLKARLIKCVVRVLYKLALTHANLKVIFQNPKDAETLSQIIDVKREDLAMIKGSGVDLTGYAFHPEPAAGPVIVTMASRLLKEKGVEEFVAAAKLVKRRGVSAEFWLVGDLDSGNPNSISDTQLSRWREEEDVKVLGFRDDIPDIFSKSHIVVFPSYYGEGVPKVLLEAAACGRPIITTDNPGCAEAVTDGENGVIVPMKNVDKLADAIMNLVDSAEARIEMGQAGRKMAETQFDVAAVVNKHLALYQELLPRSG